MSWLSQGIDWLGQKQGVAPVLGGLIGGVCTVGAAFFVTWRLNRGVKRTEFVLAFTQRYHELLGRKFKLNQEYDELENVDPVEPPDTKRERTICAKQEEAKEYYRVFFGLMFDEFFAYQRHLLDPSMFAEWMKWRLDDYNTNPSYRGDVCGMSYQQGWGTWKDVGPIGGHRFSKFMQNIHECDDYRAVVREVWLFHPCLGWARWLRDKWVGKKTGSPAWVFPLSAGLLGFIAGGSLVSALQMPIR